MKLREVFQTKQTIKQLLFVVFLFAIMIPIAIWDSNTQVKVKFSETQVVVRSDRYSMTIPYDMVEDVQLQDLADAGEELEGGSDNDIIRIGPWHNDAWGDYYICADLDAGNCIVVTLDDGRIFVFSRRDDAATAEDYESFREHLDAYGSQ